MNNTAPIGQGIAVVAGVFGLIGGTASFVAYDYSFIGAVFIALLIAAIVAVVLWLGWRPAKTHRDMTVEAHRAGQAPTVPAQGRSGSAAKPAPAAAPAPKPATATPAAAPAAKESAAEKKAAPAKAEESDYDGDGVVEGTGEGTKPATLDAAREGGPDNLKQIKGVGPKMEEMLHGMGFYHFDQVAAWTADEVAWVDANLEGFKGRVSRDNWVEQAQTLAAGGTTEFSKKVKKGGVY